MRFAAALAASLVLSTAARAAESPYLRPEFQRLTDAATFHVGFDGAAAPDMAEGPKSAPSLHFPGGDRPKTLQFSPGVVGQALVLGSGSAVYPRAGNVPLERRGSVAAWIKPENWQRPRDGNTVFAMTTNATFYLERQGPDLDADGRLTRQEGILYLVFPPGQRSANLNGGGDWPNGRWRLLVANWSWPNCELSVDGGPFDTASLSGVPDARTFGDLILGDAGGQPRGLLDEFFAFRRPLTRDEAQLLFSLGKP